MFGRFGMELPIYNTPFTCTQTKSNNLSTRYSTLAIHKPMRSLVKQKHLFSILQSHPYDLSDMYAMSVRTPWV